MFYRKEILFDLLDYELEISMRWIFVRGHYLFRELASDFPRALPEENSELQGTDNVQGQISEHIFAPNEGY